MEKPEWLRDIRVIGFDLDQTLYPKSSEIDERIQQYLYEQIALHRGTDLSEARALFIERYQSGAGLSGSQTLADLGLPNASELVQEALERADIASTLAPNEDVNALLHELHRIYKSIDLITGSNLVNAQQKLNAIGIDYRSFGKLITQDEASKSDGSAYERWLASYPELAPIHFLYVGDRVRSDHEIPHALGIRTALVYVREQNSTLPCLQHDSLLSLLNVLKR